MEKDSRWMSYRILTRGAVGGGEREHVREYYFLVSEITFYLRVRLDKPVHQYDNRWGEG